MYNFNEASADKNETPITSSIVEHHFGGFETALENLSEPQNKILLHSAHDVYIPLSPLSLSKPVPVLQFFFALQAAKKG